MGSEVGVEVRDHLRDFSQTLDIDLWPRIHLAPERAARRIHDLPQPIWTPQWLQGLQSMPRIYSDLILPKVLQLPIKAVLLRHHQCRDSLPRVFFWIPHFSRVLDGLVFKVLEKLELEEVFGVVVAVEVLQPFGEDGRGVFAGCLDGLFV